MSAPISNMATTTTFTGMGLGFAAHTATAAINTPHTSKQRARGFIDCDLKCRDQGIGAWEEGTDRLSDRRVPHPCHDFVFVARVEGPKSSRSPANVCSLFPIPCFFTSMPQSQSFASDPFRPPM